MTGSAEDEGRERRQIRSFVRRGGRVTRAQQRALDELLPRWGLPFTPQPLDFDAVFGRHAPRVLEIGFGDGETLLALARARPEADFLGVEVYPPGIGHCLLGIEAAELTNLRLIAHDAVEVLAHQIPPAALDELLLYFPDPWPKKRHHKRRLVQPAFVALAASRLRPGGMLRIATDWQPYAAQIRAVLDAEHGLVAETPPGERGQTRFERRGLRLGHEVFEFGYRRIA